MWLFNIIRFNIRLLAFAKFVEFLKSSTDKASLMHFLIFQTEDKLKLCSNLNETQPKYASKRYAF